MSNNDIYTEVTNDIIEAIETEKALPWFKEWKRQFELPVSFSSNLPYNGINILILLIKSFKIGYSSNNWMTYKQAKDKGLQVRKGEKSTRIVFYKTLEIEDKETNETNKIPMLKTFSVFNLNQIDGLPESEQDEIPQENENQYPDVEKFLNNLGSNISVGEPAYIPSTDSIRMPPKEDFKNIESYYSNSFHEHAHWTGHATRLDRKISTNHGSEHYAFEEIIADLSSAFLCAEFKLEAELRHAGYIDYWLKVLKEDNKAIFKASAAASRVCNFMHGKQDNS